MSTKNVSAQMKLKDLEDISKAVPGVPLAKIIRGLLLKVARGEISREEVLESLYR